MPYAIYSDASQRMLHALYDLDILVPFNWLGWDGIDKYRGGTGLDSAARRRRRTHGERDHPSRSVLGRNDRRNPRRRHLGRRRPPAPPMAERRSEPPADRAIGEVTLAGQGVAIRSPSASGPSVAVVRCPQTPSSPADSACLDSGPAAPAPWELLRPERHLGDMWRNVDGWDSGALRSLLVLYRVAVCPLLAHRCT